MTRRLLLAFLICSPLAALDPARDVLLSWPEADPRAAPLAREIGAAAIFVPFSVGAAAEFLQACRDAAVQPVAEIRTVTDADSLRRQTEAALSAGFTALAYDAWSDEAEVRRFASQRPQTLQFVFLKRDEVGWNVAPAHAVLVEGLWPGIKPTDPSTASATGPPWLDSNAWLYVWLRARFPDRPALLGYRPNEAAGVPKDRMLREYTVELALIEAIASGGNVVLSLPDRYRTALLAGESRAREAWQALARTSALLREHSMRFQPAPGLRVLALVGSLDESGEVLNMLFRNNATPAVAAADRMPPLDPKRHPVLVAANIPLFAADQERILGFVKAGGTVLAAPDLEAGELWWRDRAGERIREDDERTFHALGRGQFIGYRGFVIDVYEFAFDVLQALHWRARDLRLWNADTVIGFLRRHDGGRLSLQLIDYGTRWRRDHDPDFLVQIHGSYPKAVLETPELAAPINLDVRLREGLTEFEMRDLRHFATIQLEAGKQ